MTDELMARWLRIVELPDDEQAAAIEREAAGDAALRARLHELLALDRHPQLDFLDRPLLREHDDAQLAAGMQVGNYRLVRRVGEGTDGVVFEAEQSNPHRRVAVKMLRSLAPGARSIARFRLEGEALARLRHPGVAEVYEAGEFATPAGPQPYLVLELVSGIPLDAYVRDRSRAERLQLFLQVADAVAHCHAHGVVHRDLKPANVLVDADGLARLIDFGIARPSDDTEWHTAPPTLAGLEGTLAYMSPEQATSAGNRHGDARSDVYSLGVLLYELLVDRLPLPVDGQPLVDALQTIQHSAPPLLGQLDRSLRGDLEVLVGKAIAKAPDARYRSAGELADDLRRHLASEPIRARPPTRWYVFRRFARRNRTLLLAATLTFSALVAGTTASLVFAMQARQQTELALQRHDESLRRLALAQGSLSLLFDDVVEELPRLPGSGPVLERALAALTDYAAQLAAELPDSLAERRRLWRVYERLALVRLRAGAAPELVRAAADTFHAMVTRAAGEQHPDFDPTYDRFRAEWLVSITGKPERMPLAMAAADELVADPGATPQVLLDIAEALTATQHGTGSPEFDRAQALVHRVLAAEPKHPRARALQADLDSHVANRWLSRGRPELAMPILVALCASHDDELRQNPAHPARIEKLCATMRTLGDAHLGVGDVVTARTTYLEAARRIRNLIEIEPSRHHAHLTLGWILQGLANCEASPATRLATLQQSLDAFLRAPAFGSYGSIVTVAACMQTDLALQIGDVHACQLAVRHWQQITARDVEPRVLLESASRVPLTAPARRIVAAMVERARKHLANDFDPPIDPVMAARRSLTR